jgi:hypothetical protein
MLARKEHQTGDSLPAQAMRPSTITRKEKRAIASPRDRPVPIAPRTLEVTPLRRYGAEVTAQYFAATSGAPAEKR